MFLLVNSKTLTLVGEEDGKSLLYIFSHLCIFIFVPICTPTFMSFLLNIFILNTSGGSNSSPLQPFHYFLNSIANILSTKDLHFQLVKGKYINAP